MDLNYLHVGDLQPLFDGAIWMIMMDVSSARSSAVVFPFMMRPTRPQLWQFISMPHIRWRVIAKFSVQDLNQIRARPLEIWAFWPRTNTTAWKVTPCTTVGVGLLGDLHCLGKCMWSIITAWHEVKEDDPCGGFFPVIIFFSGWRRMCQSDKFTCFCRHCPSLLVLGLFFFYTVWKEASSFASYFPLTSSIYPTFFFWCVCVNGE